MPRNKQILDFAPEEDYSLIGIHCLWEAYRMAFLLNKHLGLKLKRESSDIDFQHKRILAFYQVFRYSDKKNFLDYYLVANKFSKKNEATSSQGSLFGSETLIAENLVSEHKNVDFLIKIEGECESLDLKTFISKINKIPPIRIAYKINTETLKSGENLIFN